MLEPKTMDETTAIVEEVNLILGVENHPKVLNRMRTVSVRVRTDTASQNYQVPLGFIIRLVKAHE